MNSPPIPFQNAPIMTSHTDSRPSWPQPPIPAHLLRRQRPAFALLTMPVIIVLISIPAILLSFFGIPRVFSMSSQLWKSTVGIRRGWDSLNIVLVLFAVLCGIFALGRGDEAAAEEASRTDTNMRSSSAKAEKAIEMTAEQWFQSIDRRIYELPEERTRVAGISRLRINCGSYTDLTQESWPLMGEGRFQFFDDSKVEGPYRRLDRPTRVPLRRWQSTINESEIKEIPVDTFVQGSLPPPTVATPEQVKLRPPPNPPPPPPPPIATQKKRPSYDCEAIGETTPPSPPPPPPPPPLPPRREQNPVRIERRKSSATAELKVIIASVLSANKRKKRKLKARTIEESASVRHSTDETPDRRIPPPPPLPQFFLSIFKKTSKTRGIHSASAQPPQPPPPPADHGRQSTAPRSTKPKIPKNNREDRSTRRPPGIPVVPPPPSSSFSPYQRRRSRESGIAETDGDVSWSPPTVGKKRATSSSEGDGAKGSGHVDGEDVVKVGPGPAFCESPDVNAKADTFIARLKDGWRLERMNSIRGEHGLGIGSDPL